MECPDSSILERLNKGDIQEPFLSELLAHVSSCDECLLLLNQQFSTVDNAELHSDIRSALTLKQFSQEDHCDDLVSRYSSPQSPGKNSSSKTTASRNFFEGLVIDDFRLIRHISSGGMGVVYEAEQLSLNRRVAIKLLSSLGKITDQQLQRFHNEALAAARLDHPHIVPILSVGEFNGIHYLVMKLIPGSNLAQMIEELATSKSNATQDDLPQTDSYFSPEFDTSREIPMGTTVGVSPADSDHTDAESPPPSPQGSSHRPKTQTNHRITIDANSQPFEQYLLETIERIIPVAEGLQYAHDRGIVHRDIKPSNLLIDHAGKLWISDFGVAKIESAEKLTATGGSVGTPRYMSPEQAGALPGGVDHRTDIYALGVTLYELFTLCPLFPDHHHEMLFVKIAKSEPNPPRLLNPQIPVDVETIILKAINKESTERYQSASGLADDLRRFLKGEPIQARRPGPGEIAFKWMKRHKGFVASMFSLLSVFFIASVVVISLLVIHNQKQTTLLAESEQNLQIAMNAIEDLLSKVGSEKLKDIPSFDPERRELLQAALKYYQQIITEHPTSPQIRLQTAKAYSRVGFIYYELGEFRNSAVALQKGISLLENLLQQDPDSELYLHNLANSYDYLALAIFFESKHTANWEDRAYPIRLKELEIRKMLVETHPDIARYHRELSHCYTDLGNSITDNRLLWDEAERYYRSAISVLDSYDNQFQDDAADFEFAHAHEWLGNVLNRKRNPVEARQHLETALEFNLKIYQRNPQNLSARQELAQSYFYLAGIDNVGDISPESTACLAKATQIYSEILEDHPGLFRAHRPLGQCYARAATQAMAAYRFDDAVENYQKRIEVIETIKKRFPDKAKTSGWVPHDLAIAQWLNGDHEEAKENFRLSFEFFEERIIETNRNHKSREHLAWAFSGCLVPELYNSERYLEVITELLESEPENKNYLFMLGQAHYQLENYQAAIAALDQTAGHKDLIELHCGKLFQAMSYWQLDQKEKARALYQEAESWSQNSDKGFSSFVFLKNQAEEMIFPPDSPQ